MMDDPAPSDWHDEVWDSADVAKVFRAPTTAALDRVMRGQDNLVDAERAASTLGIGIRRFHQKQADGSGPPKALDHGRIVRYLVSDLTAGI